MWFRNAGYASSDYLRQESRFLPDISALIAQIMLYIQRVQWSSGY